MLRTPWLALNLGVLLCPVVAQGITGSPWSGASVVGDVNADGHLDLIAFATATTVYTITDGATGASLGYLQRTGGVYGGVGDYDGDGCDDLAHNVPATITIVSGRDGSTLTTVAGPFARVAGADVDGDGRSDLLLQEESQSFPPAARFLWAVSSRTGAVLWQQSVGGGMSGFSAGGLQPIGDENGDGLEDAVFAVSVTLSSPSLSTSLVRGPSTILQFGIRHEVGDVDGDGRVDAFEQSPSTFSWRLVAGGSGATLWAPAVVAPSFRRLGDVDGDGRADFFFVDPFAGLPPVAMSGATLQAMPGFAPTAPLATLPFTLGDVDGDGRAEFAFLGIAYEWVDPALPAASRVAARGTPGTTHDGRRPKVVARGHAGLGNLFFLDVRGGLPNGFVLMLLGGSAEVDLASIGAPGNRSYTTLDSAFALVANGVGVAQYGATMPVSPSLLGVSISVQAAVVDGLANGLGLVLSNALDVTTSN